jgi:hypothetical protein
MAISFAGWLDLYPYDERAVAKSTDSRNFSVSVATLLELWARATPCGSIALEAPIVAYTDF